jgi:uncharacterized peroxidase-related enzyme
VGQAFGLPNFCHGLPASASRIYTGAMAITLVDPAQNEFLAALEAKSRQPNPFFRVMANRPEALKNFVPFYSAVMGPGSVDRRLKLLLYLAASFANQCAFCIAANSAAALKAGVTSEEISNVRSEHDAAFSAAEQAAIAYARSLTRTANASDAAREALSEHFSSEQIVEITLVIAMSNFTNRFNNGLNILPEGH